MKAGTTKTGVRLLSFPLGQISIPAETICVFILVESSGVDQEPTGDLMSLGKHNGILEP